MKDFILRKLSEVKNGYSLCGIVDRRGRVYPLGSDSKVVSTLFEILTRRAVAEYATVSALSLVEPRRQNYYPDFTLVGGESDQGKIAIDVKTTYLRKGTERFGYSLGSYTSYIRPETERKNIVFPYREYGEHWIIGFVYARSEHHPAPDTGIYSIETLGKIPLPFGEVEVFMQEKRRIAGDRAGSGNTANIGSIRGTIEDFVSGNGVFESEDEFLEYWRGYGRTAEERERGYSTVHEFRAARR